MEFDGSFDSAMRLLDDIVSRDPARIWSSACAIRTLRDKQALSTLASHLDMIRERTQGVSLGGALRPNSSHLQFALKKLEFVKSSSECLCALYPQDEMYDPAKEEAQGHVRILETVRLAGGWVDHHQCACSLCGANYRVEEREYHYTWWAWMRTDSMSEEASNLVTDLARQAMRMVRATSPDWTDVFIRFNADDSHCGWKGSYVDPSGVHLFDVLQLPSESEHIRRIGSLLRDALSRNGKKFVVCLVRANSRFQYQIDFEWHDEDKWNITKLGGRSGLPEGLEALSPLA